MNNNGNATGSRIRNKIDDLPRLVKTLAQSGDGFSLHFVVFDSQASQDRIFKALEPIPEIPLTHIDLSTISDPMQSLVKHIATAPENDYIAILGLDKTVMPEDGEFRFDILENLNLRLTDLRRLNRKMIFFLPIDFMEAVREDAPDMWGWRSHLFLFEEADQDRFRLTCYLSDHFSDSFCAETHSKKQNLMALYKAMKFEYEEDTSDLAMKYNVLGKVGTLSYKIGDYKTAEEIFNQQMDLAMLIGNEAFFPEILNNLGKLHEAKGSYEEALTFLNQAKTIGEKKLRGDNHPAKMITLANIGDVECSLGKYESSYRNCRKALRMGENKLGMRHPGLIPILLKLGRICRKMKSYEDALDNFRRALQIVESRLQIEHPYASVIMQNIGMTYYSQNRLEMARRYVYRTLEMAERALGPEHPHLGSLLNDIGLTHFHTDNGDTALKYFFWAADIRTKTVGGDDFTVGTIYSNIARVYQTQGKYQDAQICFQKTLDIYKNRLSKNHPYIQHVQESLYVVEEAIAAE